MNSLRSVTRGFIKMQTFAKLSNRLHHISIVFAHAPHLARVHSPNRAKKETETTNLAVCRCHLYLALSWWHWNGFWMSIKHIVVARRPTPNQQTQTSSLIRFFYSSLVAFRTPHNRHRTPPESRWMWFTLGLADIKIDVQAPFPPVLHIVSNWNRVLFSHHHSAVFLTFINK